MRGANCFMGMVTSTMASVMTPDAVQAPVVLLEGRQVPWRRRRPPARRRGGARDVATCSDVTGPSGVAVGAMAARQRQRREPPRGSRLRRRLPTRRCRSSLACTGRASRGDLRASATVCDFRADRRDRRSRRASSGRAGRRHRPERGAARAPSRHARSAARRARVPDGRACGSASASRRPGPRARRRVERRCRRSPDGRYTQRQRRASGHGHLVVTRSPSRSECRADSRTSWRSRGGLPVRPRPPRRGRRRA